MNPASQPVATGAFRRYVWPLLVQNRWALSLAFVLVGLSGGAVAVQNVFPKWLFSYVLEAADLSMTERWWRLGQLAVIYLFLTAIVRMLFWHLGFRLFTRVREHIVFALRRRFFRHVNHLCLRFHGTHTSGELFSYLFGSPLRAVMDFFQHTTMNVPASITSIVFTLVIFSIWDWVLAVILMATSLFSVHMMLRARRLVELIQRDFQAVEGDVSGRVADLLRGNKTVKLHAMEAEVARSFELEAETIRVKSYRRDVLSHVEWIKQEGLGYVCYAVLMAACTWRYFSGHIDLGMVAACLAAFAGLSGPIQGIFQSFTLWGGAEAALNRIGAVLDTATTTPDPEQPREELPASGALVFEQVSFGYDPARPILRGFDLRIEPGERVAFVGPSGAGKTTVTQLLLRLYDPQAGRILLGSTDLRSVSTQTLRRYFGVVPQDPFLFNTTMRDNLRVARPEASDAEILMACAQANALEFIEALPGGLDARVGEAGSMLSGGQRQRLAIARALLSEPRCFIFDEATSALDTLSEKLISEAIDRMLCGRTALFIAHRLDTARRCDRIVVMADGAIVQQGPYAELAAKPGLFRDLVQGRELRD
jgi:ABC-type multidrug transport system fused ATPase/permease subunit